MAAIAQAAEAADMTVPERDVLAAAAALLDQGGRIDRLSRR